MKHLNLNVEAPGVLSLESLNEQIAMESGFVGRIATTLMDVIPNLVHGAKKKLVGTRLDKYDLRFVDVNKTVMQRAIKEGSYANISDFPVPVPQGFNGNYLQLCDALTQCIVHSNDALQRLQEYSQFLANVISSVDARRSMRDYTGVMKGYDAQREKVSTIYGKLFTTDSVQALSKYGQVVDSNKQWFEVYDALDKLCALGREQKLNVLESTVTEIVALLDALQERITSKTITDMTPETLRSLSAMTVTAAREVEFCAISLYRLSETKKCYETACANLIKALR